MGLLSRIFHRDNTSATSGINKVAVIRSSGELETGWSVYGVLDNTVWVSSEGRCKQIPMADFLRANPELLIGRTLRIQGSSGTFESNWEAVSFHDYGHVKMTKRGRAKTISLEQIVEWNDWGGAFAQAA